MLECVVNVSEGRRADALATFASAAGTALLDVHSDPHHHRSVLTLAGPEVEAAARAVTETAVALLDLSDHTGVHPRLGVVDVVPFAPLEDSTLADAIAARDRLAIWACDHLALPCFIYGPGGRSLPEIRRSAFAGLLPDHGPQVPHGTAGAVCVGARRVLIAYNLWLAPGAPVSVARAMAAQLRSPTVRALGLDVGGRSQVSLNLIDPVRFGPAAAYDAAAALGPVVSAELVGLVPAAALDRIPPNRWTELDMGRDRTIEVRVAAARTLW